MTETILERTIINQENRYQKLIEQAIFKANGHKHEQVLTPQIDNIIKQLRSRKDYFCVRCQKYKGINLNEGEIAFDAMYLCHDNTFDCPHDIAPVWKVYSYCNNCLPYIQTGYALENETISRVDATLHEESKNYSWVANEMEKRKFKRMVEQVQKEHRWTQTHDGEGTISFWYNGQDFTRTISPEVMKFTSGNLQQLLEIKQKAYEDIVKLILMDERKYDNR